MKRIALVCMTVALVVAAVAVARPAKPHHPTDLVVENTAVSGNGQITVSGRVKSDSGDCSRFRGVVLVRIKNGEEQDLDYGVSSERGRVWILRSKPGMADGSPIFVEAYRESVTIVTVRGHHRPHRRSFVCKADRERVDYFQ
jgi:hypothetical protein